MFNDLCRVFVAHKCHFYNHIAGDNASQMTRSFVIIITKGMDGGMFVCIYINILLNISILTLYHFEIFSLLFVIFSLNTFQAFEIWENQEPDI